MNEPPLLNNPAERIGRLLTIENGRTMIALAGVPGSGKTTYANALANQVNQLYGDGTMVSLGMDGFHLTKAELKAMPNSDEMLARRGAHWTFDPLALANNLEELRANFGRQAVTWPGFEHGVGDPVPDGYIIDPSIRIILVEGLYLLYREGDWSNVFSKFNERWFLDTPIDVARERLTLRHMATRGVSREDAEMRIDSNDRLNANLTLTTRAESTWRVQ